MAEVLNYLEKIDPEAAKRARERYSCFDHFGEDTQRYGYMAGLGSPNRARKRSSVNSSNFTAERPNLLHATAALQRTISFTPSRTRGW